MVDYHIPLKLVYREHLRRVIERDVRVFGGVGVGDPFVIMPVVEEQIVKKPRARRWFRVKAEEAAQQEIVVGHIQRVLKARRAAVMSEFAEAKHRFIVKKIAYAAVVVVYRGEILFWEHSSEHNKNHLYKFDMYILYLFFRTNAMVFFYFVKC